jgi:hypothetical protein
LSDDKPPQPQKPFPCRHSDDLSYQRQWDNEIFRALHRAQDIRQRLGGNANMMGSFPQTSKGMHHVTYMRMFWEHHEAEMENLAGMREWLDKMERQLT